MANYGISNLSEVTGKNNTLRVSYAFNAQALNDDVAAFNAFRKALYGDLNGRHKRRLERYLGAIMASHFDSQQSRVGNSWADLKESTQQARKEMGAGEKEPKLIVSGRMYAAAKNVRIKSTQGANKVIYVQPNDGKALNSKLSAQFAVHNRPTGTAKTMTNKYGTVSIPGREFFYLREEYVQPIAELVVTDAMDALRKTMKPGSFIHVSTGILKGGMASGLGPVIRAQQKRVGRRQGKL